MARETVEFLVGDQRERREKVLMGGRLFQSDTYCKKRRTKQQHQLTSAFFTEEIKGSPNSTFSFEA
jgi:hypothetical protein